MRFAAVAGPPHVRRGKLICSGPPTVTPPAPRPPRRPHPPPSHRQYRGPLSAGRNRARPFPEQRRRVRQAGQRLAAKRPRISIPFLVRLLRTRRLAPPPCVARSKCHATIERAGRRGGMALAGSPGHTLTITRFYLSLSVTLCSLGHRQAARGFRCLRSAPASGAVLRSPTRGLLPFGSPVALKSLASLF